MRTVGIGARTEKSAIVADLEAENKMIKKTNKDARDRISDLEAMLDESREEAAVLQKQLDESREEAAILQKQLDEEKKSKSSKEKNTGK